MGTSSDYDKLNSGHNSGANKQSGSGGSGSKQQSGVDKVKEQTQQRTHDTLNKK